MKNLPPVGWSQPLAVNIYKILTALAGSMHENYFLGFLSPFLAAIHKASTNTPIVPPKTHPKINQIKIHSSQLPLKNHTTFKNNTSKIHFFYE